MTDLPSGTVTFLFTDIEGSTRLAQQYPDALPALLARHHEILRQSIQAHNGYVFQVVGDSFAAAFHNASDALNAALDAQQSLYNEPWAPAPVKVRMGVHTGAAQLNDISAPTVYTGYATIALTQRIMSCGHGGQVLLSGATRELVRDVLPTNTDLLDLGEKRLKDLLRPERLYQLNIAGLPSTFSPLKTLDAFQHNLPVQLTTFIGREQELMEVKRELESHRLVTLTGSGGTGKTRLSLQVAAELLDHFDHGLWFVELASLRDPELIPQTILSAIGIQEQRGKPVLELLKSYLHEKKLLLILDNCEHLIEASANLVNALLNAAPPLKILASSREALGVQGEVAYPVPSLSLPDLKELPVIEQLSQYEAVRLFLDRASLVAPHFGVDKNSAPFIAQICYRLDGIPLAIELAAARVKVMSVEQISGRLDDCFRLLTGGARTVLPRQQTLRALIDWSYDLLTENERLLLRRLSVFAGGWTLEAAEAVCECNGIEAYDVLDLLTQLVNKSLVAVIQHSQSDEVRYRMLETIRQYAREKLLETEENEGLRLKHLVYFIELAERAEPELIRSNQVFWSKKLSDELDNLRLAMEWALAKDSRSGMRLITALRYFWQVPGDIQEVEAWVAQLLEQYKEMDSLRVRGLLVKANIAGRRGNLKQAEIISNESLELSRAISDKQGEALSLLGLGGVISLQGDVERGIPIIEQSLSLFQSLADKFGQASAMGWLSLLHNDLERSKSFLFESLGRYRELGNISGIAVCLSLLAHRATWGGDFPSAREWLQEARTIYHQLGNRFGEAEVIQYFGDLAYWQGDFQQAGSYYEEALSLSERVGNYATALWSRVNLSYTMLRQGNLSKAREMFEVCSRFFQGEGNTIGLIYAIEGLASLSLNQEQAERAAQLFAWADAMREKMGDHRPPVEQASVERDLAVISSKLGGAAFARFSAGGQAMTIEEAMALALQS